MTKLLYIAPHRPGRSPGQRFRFELMMAHLAQNGYQIEYANIITEKEDRVFYRPGHLLQKALIVWRSFFRRLRHLKKAKNFDLIYIYREAHMLGATYFEKRLAKTGVPVVYDFDDAIWLNDTSQGNSKLKWLKKPSKTSKIISCANLSLAGNSYLADYARRFSSHVEVFPTLLDTDYHRRSPKPRSGPLVIGWTGTSTTLKHFETALPALRILKKKYGGKIEIRLIVNYPYQVPGLEINCINWDKSREIEELSEFDIGIMPLPDDEWSRGKCGFKALQYMSLCIPCVISAVGVNNEIADDGINAFLAHKEEDWLDKLEMLIASEELREKMGKEGRETVVSSYSVSAWQDRFLNMIGPLVDTKHRPGAQG